MKILCGHRVSFKLVLGSGEPVQDDGESITSTILEPGPSGAQSSALASDVRTIID